VRGASRRPPAVPRRIADCSFLLLANGAADSPPASGLRDYLRARGARVTTIIHPLGPEHGNRHEITSYAPGGTARRRVLRIPSRPPYTFPLDALVPPLPPRVDGWFAYNNLLAARGVAARAMRRADTVVYWAVDFVPDRFGPGSPMTRVYDRLDAWVCRHADHWVDLSRPALEGRAERHGLHPGRDTAPAQVVPVGVWLDRVPAVPEDGWRARRVAFLGHLVPRQGVLPLVRAIALLRARGEEVGLDIAGHGPQEEELRRAAAQSGVADLVRFHGFISDHREVERFLTRSSVAAAPYARDPDSFTRFADPSKLKSYLAAGLPIVMTDVPHNAGELAARAGAEVVPDDAEPIADAILRCLSSPEGWRERRAAALAYARGFDWNTLLAAALAPMGFVEDPGAAASTTT
jgi:glycosyltransferase involved in cell wall biosynthesis